MMLCQAIINNIYPASSPLPQNTGERYQAADIPILMKVQVVRGTRAKTFCLRDTNRYGRSFGAAL
jgi:hypothetical protein